MLEEVNSGIITINQLLAISEEALAAQYSVSRDTVRRAKESILSEIVED